MICASTGRQGPGHSDSLTRLEALALERTTLKEKLVYLWDLVVEPVLDRIDMLMEEAEFRVARLAKRMPMVSAPPHAPPQ